MAGAHLAVDELTGLVRGQVAVGTVTYHNVDLPALLAAFHEDHPAVEITLAEGNSDQLIDPLRGARLDAAIIALGATPPPDLEIHIVADESIAAAVSHSDHLAKRSTIPLDLHDRALISLPAGTGIRSHLDDACAAAGFTPHIAFEASSPLVLAQLAARGLGVAIMPASVARARDDLHPPKDHPARTTRASGLRLAGRKPDQSRHPRRGRTSSANAQHVMVALQGSRMARSWKYCAKRVDWRPRMVTSPHRTPCRWVLHMGTPTRTELSGSVGFPTARVLSTENLHLYTVC